MRVIFTVFAALTIAAAASAATTPASATLTPSNPAVSFTGGPYSVSNPSTPTGDNPPVCTDQICGQFAMTVAIPPTDTHAYKANVLVTWTSSGTTTQGSSSSDFDLYIYQPDVTGTRVAQGPGTSYPEQTSFGVSNKTYTIYVVPYDVSPTVMFNATVSLEQIPDSGAIVWGPNVGNTVVPAGTPRFYNYQAPPGVGEDSGEPLIGVNRKTEKVFGGIPNGGTVNYYGGFLPYMLSLTFDDRTAPATTTWKQVPLVLPNLPRAYGDPYLFTDRDTGRTFVTQEMALTPLGSTMEFTDNDDAPLTPSTGSGAPSGIDHETIGGGPFHAPIPTGVNPLYPNSVWYCSQALVDAVCSISLDGGITFGPAVPMYTLNDCVGIHGHIKIARDGTAYIPNRQCHFGDGDHQGLVVSENNGITWTVRPVPASTPGDRDPAVAVADDGTVYFAYQATDGHSHVSVSHDRGLTWDSDTDVGAQLGIQNAVFHQAVAGDGPRAAVAYIGTQTGGTNYNLPDFPGTWYLFISTTFDGGHTWVTQNASPGDPVQRGGICDDGACRNLLDFIGAAIDKQGRVLIGYDDGCISNGCISGSRPYGLTGGNDYTAKAVIARQASGKRMYAQFDSQSGPDITPPLPPSAPAAMTSCDGTLVATDPAGDADHPLLHSTGGPYDQVDITGVSFGVDAAKTTLTTTLTLKNFTAQPILGSLGTFYYTTWTSVGKNPDGTPVTRTYATRAAVNVQGAVAYSFGLYDQAADAFVGTATTVTGSFTPGPNGTLSVNVPLSLLGNPTIPVTNPTSAPAVIEPYAVAIIHEQQVRFTMPADRAPNPGSFGASWSVCLPPKVTCIDEEAPAIVYSDNWHDLGATRMHAGAAKNDTAKLPFNVTGGSGKLTYNYATSPKGGSAEVFIDGVSRGTISYLGLQGSTKAPAVGASVTYSGLAAGSHLFELRNMSGNVYIDGFCLENATTSGTATSGPAATSSSSTVNVPANAYSVSVFGEALGTVPVSIALVDPSGLTLSTANVLAGVAVMTVPVTQAGTYTVKVIGVNVGPAQVWTVATPNVTR